LVHRIGSLLAVLLLAASCASVPQPGLWKVPEGFKVVGYFPSWSGDPSSIRYEALTHINYAFGLASAAGDYQPLEAPEKLTALVVRAHDAGVRVLLSVGGWNEGSTKGLDTIAADPEITNHFLDQTRQLLAQYNLDGVDLDWEYPRASTTVAYGALVTALAGALHDQGKVLSLAVSANGMNGQYVGDEAWGAADWINVMAYDDGWASAGVPHSSYAFARASIDYWVGTRGLPPAKVVLGVPFYGRSLADRKARSYRSLLDTYPGADQTDVSGAFAYNGFDTLRSKVVNQARVRAGGVMVWQLNQDARGPKSLLSLIYETVKEPAE